MSRANRGRAWRPALAGGIILALLVGVFSFAPSRAWARQLLGIFRVNKFAVVSVAPDQARIEAAGQALQDKLFVGEPEMIADEPTVQVKSVAEASQKAGFTVRVPKALSAKPQISVKGRSEASFTFSREGLVTLLNLAGMDPAAIPNNFNTAKLHVTVPAMANVEIGDYRITQVRAPEIDYPEGIDPQVIGQAGLRIMGVSPQEAERITGKLDWTNTLLLPIPKDAAEYREVIVAGEQGVILIPRPQAVKQAAKVAAEAPSTSIRQSDVDKVESVSSESTLVFEMDGIIYVVSANTSPESLVRIAESLF